MQDIARIFKLKETVVGDSLAHLSQISWLKIRKSEACFSFSSFQFQFHLLSNSFL